MCSRDQVEGFVQGWPAWVTLELCFGLPRAVSWNPPRTQFYRPGAFRSYLLEVAADLGDSFDLNMSHSAKVLITGAAGYLGRQIVGRLSPDYPNLVATDVVAPDDLPYSVRVCDLRDHEAVSTLMEGVDTVVHLGNHPRLKHPQTTFNDNVSINMNVFQAAAETGVKRIVFASTVQLIGSHVDERTVLHPPDLPTIPISGKTAPAPANTYALSKTVSETMLRYYVDRCGLSCTAIRFPLITTERFERHPRFNRIDADVLFEGFGVLSIADSAELCAAILAADLPGFRVYSPGVPGRCAETPLPELIEKYYPGLSPDLPSLIDNTTITRETGWVPRDHLR